MIYFLKKREFNMEDIVNDLIQVAKVCFEKIRFQLYK